MNAATALRCTLGALAPLTVDELAAVLGCRPDTVRELVADLRPVKVGRAARYLYGEVLERVRPDVEPVKVGERKGKVIQARREAL